MFGKPPGLKEFIEKRTASVAAQVAGTSKGYIPSGGPGGGGPPQIGALLAGPMLAALDTDRDEELSREEWLAAGKKLFAACERDGDGRVDLKSLTAGLNSLFPPPPEGAPRGFAIGGFLAGPILTRADANKDGKLTFEELLVAAGVIFDEFDKRKAGKLDEEAFAQLLTKLLPLPNVGRPPGGPSKEGK
jgi:Ca2+-binding EF-hand superfamily protein